MTISLLLLPESLPVSKHLGRGSLIGTGICGTPLCTLLTGLVTKPGKDSEAVSQALLDAVLVLLFHHPGALLVELRFDGGDIHVTPVL